MKVVNEEFMAGMFFSCIVTVITVTGNAWCGGETPPVPAPQSGNVFAGREETVLLDSVAVSGGEPVEAGELAGVMLSRRGGVLNEGLIRHDIEALTALIHTHGWWNAEVTAAVDTTGSGGVHLTFEVKKGEPVIVGDIVTAITGDRPPGLPGADTAGMSGQPFSQPLLDRIVGSIVAGFAANGYPGVTVRPFLAARGDTVDITLSILPGERARIDSIAVRGLTRTKDSVVRRELRRLNGLPAGPGALESAKNLTRSISMVRFTRAPYLDYTDDGRCVLVTDVEEGSQGTFEGILGYQPSSVGQTSEIIGKIDLAFHNILGTGRSTRIRWENLGKASEDMELRYTEPWIFGYPYSVSGAFMQEEREKLGYTRTIIRSSVSRSIGNIRTDAGYRFEKVSADSVYSSSAHGFDAGLIWNRIDTPSNPRSGILYEVRWTAVAKRPRFGKRDTRSLERLEFDLDHYVPTFTSQAVAVLVRYRRVDTPRETLSPSDRYLLGGATSIRGYRERIFPAVNALWMTTEYRILRGQASRVFAFIDTGYLINYEKAPDGGFTKTTRNLTGYGFGLRIESRAGALGFDLGLGRGDGIGDGKLHVSLSNRF